MCSMTSVSSTSYLMSSMTTLSRTLYLMSSMSCKSKKPRKVRQKKEKKKWGWQLSSWQIFFFGGGKCPNLGVVNVRILGVVNVRLANNLTPIFFHFLRVWKYNTDLSPERFFLNCVKWPFSCTIQNTQHCQVISAEPNLNKFPLLAKGNLDDFWLHFALQCILCWLFLGSPSSRDCSSHLTICRPKRPRGLQAPLIKCLHHHHPHLHHLYYCLPW